MYFIAYILNPSVRVIIPTTWVKDIDRHWEKFVNNSLNRNQRFLVFYSESVNAIDEQGRPNVDFAPDFNLGTNVVFPQTGCYLAKLLHFKGNYDDALKIIQRRRRNVAPALYNIDRLDEQPIPIVQSDVAIQIDPENMPANSSNSLVNETVDGGIDERLISVEMEQNNSLDDPLAIESSAPENMTHNETQQTDSLTNESVASSVVSTAIGIDLMNEVVAPNENERIDSLTNESVASSIVSTAIGIDLMDQTAALNVSEGNGSSVNEPVASKTVFTACDNDLMDQTAALNVTEETANDPMTIESTVHEIMTTHETEQTNSLTNDQSASSTVSTASDNDLMKEIVALNETEQSNSLTNEPFASSIVSTASGIDLMKEIVGLNEIEQNEPLATFDSTAPNSPSQVHGATLVMVAGPSNASQNDCIAPIKVENLLITPFDENVIELDGILNQADMSNDIEIKKIDDDLIMISDKTVSFKPYQINAEKLIKQDNDVVSGDLPFTQKKTGRIYPFGEKQVLVPQNVVEKIKDLNQNEEKSGQEFDEYVTIVLLLVCAHPKHLATGQIDTEVKDFIRGFLKVRAKDDEKRLGFMENYIINYFESKSKSPNAPTAESVTESTTESLDESSQEIMK